MASALQLLFRMKPLVILFYCISPFLFFGCGSSEGDSAWGSGASQSLSSTAAAGSTQTPSSTELHTTFVKSLYTDFIGRAGSDTEVSAWVGIADSSKDCATIARAFAYSGEYMAREATLTPYQISYDFFHGILGRSADQSTDPIYWPQVFINSGYNALAEGFINSDEFKAHCTNFDLTWIAKAN